MSQNTTNRQPARVLAMMDTLCAACACGPVADMGGCRLLENLGEEEQVGTQQLLQVSPAAPAAQRLSLTQPSASAA